MSQALIKRLVSAKIKANPPTTQEDFCRICAEVVHFVGPFPQSDLEFIDFAVEGAREIFGPAFDAVEEWQRIAWIDMYERSLRSVAQLYQSETA